MNKLILAAAIAAASHSLAVGQSHKVVLHQKALKVAGLPPLGVTIVTSVAKQARHIQNPRDHITVHAVNVDLKNALAQVFDAAGANFVIRPSVHDDSVSCSLHDYAFKEAIDTILSAVNQKLVCTQQAEMYVIEPAPLISPDRPSFFEMSPDLIDGWDAPVSKLDVVNTDVRAVVEALFRRVNMSFMLDADVQGTVNVSLHNVSFRNVLLNVLRQADAKFDVVDRIVRIRKIEPSDKTAHQPFPRGFPGGRRPGIPGFGG